MREQGSSKGEGTHGEISASTFLGKLCHRRISVPRENHKNVNLRHLIRSDLQRKSGNYFMS